MAFYPPAYRVATDNTNYLLIERIAIVIVPIRDELRVPIIINKFQPRDVVVNIVRAASGSHSVLATV